MLVSLSFYLRFRRMAAAPPSVLRRLHPAFLAWLRAHDLETNLGFSAYYSAEEIANGEAAMDLLLELHLEEDHIDKLQSDIELLTNSLRSRVQQLHLSFARKEPHDFHFQRKREVREDAERQQLLKVARFEAREQRAQPPPAPTRQVFGSRLRRAQALEGDSAARHKAEEAQRKLWLRRLLDALRSVNAPSVRLAEKSKHAEDILELQIGPRRAGTLRLRVRAWARYREWLQMSYGLNHPADPHHFLDYLLDRRAEPCSRGVLASMVDTMRFVEKAMGLTQELRVTENEYVKQTVAGILRSTSAQAMGAARGPARALVVWCLIELERTVMNAQRLPYDRMLSWWMLMSSWAVLRFDDHRGIGSSGVSSDGLGVNLLMTRTKTTGQDKAVQNKPGFVAWSAWLTEPERMQTGYDLWLQHAPWERDYLLVVLAADGVCRPREIKYAEYAGRMRGVLASLDIPGYGAAGGSVAAFWRPHSWRTFLPSALEALGAPSSSLGWLSAWKPQSGAAYVRTQKEKTRVIQATVARILRAHLDGDDPIGETGSLREIEMHLGDRGLAVEEAAVICAGMRKFLGPPVEEILWPRVREDAEPTVPPPEAEEAEGEKEQEDSGEELKAPRWENGYIVSISSGRRVRRLHRLGLCHRRPGIHYHRYEEYGAKFPPPSQYNDYCKDCWKKDAPGSQGERDDSSETGGGTSSSSASSFADHAASSQG